MADNATTGTTGSKTGTGWVPDNGGLPSTGRGNAGAATGTATGLAKTAQEYADKVSDVASHAKDYVTDKVGAVSDKIKEIDFAELSDNAKEYAKQNPGQTILISAGVGLLLGLLIRGRR
jgi:ElaB/YqjD/DUF883 family membrane-anchored ribosome-binding protein